MRRARAGSHHGPCSSRHACTGTHNRQRSNSGSHAHEHSNPDIHANTFTYANADPDPHSYPLVAVACSSAPEGHTRWTLRLLADQVVKLEFTDSICRETVRQVLKKTNSNHGKRRSGAYRR